MGLEIGRRSGFGMLVVWCRGIQQLAHVVSVVMLPVDPVLHNYDRLLQPNTRASHV